MAQSGPGKDRDQLLRSLNSAMKPLADPARAKAMRAYMRDQFEYFGIPTPVRRATVTPLLKAFSPSTPADLIAAAHALWEKPEREFQYAGVELLVIHSKIFTVADFDQIFGLVQTKSWWDTVDSLVKVFGSVVLRERKAGQRAMDRALRSKNMWVRRVAMLHQLGWRGETDTERLFSYALHLAPEKEFFIRKAVGWALRDYSWHDGAAVRKFLKEHGSLLSPLSYREASKRLK